ncbi:DUF1801 domain-containing protein [Pseudoalteromonas tunicata]|uniref:DUF1801 domain-containing protein n=1 Tax=Pseudoalteromonas tunicata TaxID=314281 RepID=UPI00273D3122|nr:DUF1801 domain-containing protein [Pseudoalteromonas tunicata]MDP4985494.1 DUF1801 domain-containing protein [Pseudoalteromonas tunicata]MDP5214486.1 DUF1801 domain-containing protein [Pseudoalteromonas tunicata]
MNEKVTEKFLSYPAPAQTQLLLLHELIHELCREHNLGVITESLKWGEASYSVSGGSSIRLDFKPKTPDHFYLFFNCKTQLVSTFKELYQQELTFIGNRAIMLNINEPIPIKPIRHCLLLALQYKKLKHLPLLGC